MAPWSSPDGTIHPGSVGCGRVWCTHPGRTTIDRVTRSSVPLEVVVGDDLASGQISLQIDAPDDLVADVVAGKACVLDAPWFEHIAGQCGREVEYVGGTGKRAAVDDGRHGRDPVPPESHERAAWQRPVRHAHDRPAVSHATCGPVAVEPRSVPGNDGCVAPAAWLGSDAGPVLRGPPRLCVPRCRPASGRKSSRTVLGPEFATPLRGPTRSGLVTGTSVCPVRPLSCEPSSLDLTLLRQSLGVEVPRQGRSSDRAVGIQRQGDGLRDWIRQQGLELRATHRVRALGREARSDRIASRFACHRLGSMQRVSWLDDTPTDVREHAGEARFEADVRPIYGRGRCGRRARQ